MSILFIPRFTVHSNSIQYCICDAQGGIVAVSKEFIGCSANLLTFFAITHAIKLCIERKEMAPIYTNNQSAYKWVQDKKCNTVAPTDEAEKWIKAAEERLNNLPFEYPVLKWNTKEWGDITTTLQILKP